MDAPKTREELIARADALAGRTVGQVATRLGLEVPPDLRHHKGWVGHVIEKALGAPAGSAAGPDFPGLRVELKTIPVDASAVPRESTWVCWAPLDGSMAAAWRESLAYSKLAAVLWVPIVGDGPPGDRFIGSAVAWSPDADEERALREDWEEITELIRDGRIDLLNASLGTALQLRPKGANSRDVVRFLGPDGEWAETGPRGFYLRRSFTTEVLNKAFG
ncbi:MAG: DNA mismatch repair endonuclease MutH [Proteobacteria bacterium]|nr:DNA mismatch repair endonuclease MutH [Pseudomonadota bacterium]